jgi:hypothetical protein
MRFAVRLTCPAQIAADTGGRGALGCWLKNVWL